MLNNWYIHGHDWAVDYLRKGMVNNRVRHAYLITGVPSIGKRTLAQSFAMALNCTHADLEMRPCGECRSCKKSFTGNHPDLIFSENDPTTGALRIDEVRRVSSLIALKPYETRYRIAIFEDFHRAGGTAQDALLKTLEEPPPHAIMILLTPSLEPILSTITSRSQIIHLRPVATQQVHDTLTAHYNVEEAQATLLARLSSGRIGWAIGAAGNPETLEQREQALNMLEDIIGNNRKYRFDLAQDLSKDKDSLRILLELWMTYWRDLLLLTENAPIKPSNVDRQVSLEQMVYSVRPEDALKAIKATQTLIGYLNWNINVRLALEVMFLDYPGLEG
jgi:DNA polymerase-3 subunit delta'